MGKKEKEGWKQRDKKEEEVTVHSSEFYCPSAKSRYDNVIFIPWNPIKDDDTSSILFVNAIIVIIEFHVKEEKSFGRKISIK